MYLTKHIHSTMVASPIGRSLRGLQWPRSRFILNDDRTCRSCRIQPVLRGRFSSTRSSSGKPYYITTPIFYVNAAPHVGHLYTMVLTDILKRWQLLQGKRALLCTGTDEHGMKIQQAAAVAQMEPKEFCDIGAETFQLLAKKADLSNDHFIRTTDENHREAVQYAWQMLKEREHIYESKHEGWYSVSDETFYPESTIEKRLDPFDGRLFMASQETGKEVEWTSEVNYHFRLSAFRDRLLEFYEQNPDFIVPKTRMNDVVRWVSEGLEDLSISRPASRLTWGIPVPDDESQTIYVWLDALVNYITKANYPWSPGQENTGGWPADVQVIGKDIVRFHCIYWPAFLMALEIPPPKQILTHAHWTLGRQKMAKSTGNVVNPFFALDRFGVDVMRYYLAHDGGISNDSDYGNEHIVDKYKKGLQGGLGNLVSRITRPKAWSVHESVMVVTSGEASKVIDVDCLLEKEIGALRSNVTESFRELNPGAALHRIMEMVYQTNRYLHNRAPWTLVKQSTEKDQVHRIVYNAAESCRIVGILLQPYMPTKATQLLDMLGVEPSKRTYDDAVYGSDRTYGKSTVPLGKCAFDGLFPPLSIED